MGLLSAGFIVFILVFVLVGLDLVLLVAVHRPETTRDEFFFYWEVGSSFSRIRASVGSLLPDEHCDDVSTVTPPLSTVCIYTVEFFLRRVNASIASSNCIYCMSAGQRDGMLQHAASSEASSSESEPWKTE